jgi:hypothetical protein
MIHIFAALLLYQGYAGELYPDYLVSNNSNFLFECCEEALLVIKFVCRLKAEEDTDFITSFE